MATLDPRLIDAAAQLWDNVDDYDAPAFPEYLRGQVETIMYATVFDSGDDAEEVRQQICSAIRLRIIIAEEESVLRHILSGDR